MLTKAQEDFLGICWKLKVVNIIPQAAKLGIPEAEARKYLGTKGLTIEDGGFVFQGTKVDRKVEDKVMDRNQYGQNPEHLYPTTKDKCGCVRIRGEHVIDFCQRHALNEIIHAIKGLSGSLSDIASEIEKKG